MRLQEAQRIVAMRGGAGEEEQDKEYPLFVTWNTLRGGGDKRLRGCIGTFHAQGLEHGLAEYAMVSAFQDHRFRPIGQRELMGLQCSITLLYDFEEVGDVMDWVLGEHGVRISFRSGGRSYSATFLPDVMGEQGWSKEDTLDALLRKAEYYDRQGRPQAWRYLDNVVFTRYKGSKASMRFTEYLQLVNEAKRNLPN